MEKSDLKILLLQIREDQSVKQEELESFARYACLEIEQFKTFNVFDQPNFGKEILDGVDALIVGGASEASVLEPEKYPFVESIQKLLNETIKTSLPVFASCFGFQAAVLALGGEILRDRSNFEMGTYPIKLTDTSKLDPIYKKIPNLFQAVSVHQEKAVQLPSNCDLLAFTDECCHSFRVKDKPFWAFQFHPELDKECLIERLGIYQKKYTEDANHFQDIIDSLKDTPHSNSLVKHFIDYIVS